MAELKTKKNNASIYDFLNTVEKEEKRNDCFQILSIIEKIIGEQPKMWGDSIIGFGYYHYKYASGREGDWFICGFSPRKAAITIYLMSCDLSKMENTLKKLGKHKVGKGCLYINKLSDIDINVLKKVIKESLNNTTSKK